MTTTADLLERLEGLEESARSDALRADDEGALADLRRKYLGRAGRVQEVLRGIADVPVEDRPRLGKRANDVKRTVDAIFEARLEAIENARREKDLAERSKDLTLPGRSTRAGGRHPIVATSEELEAIFRNMGFDVARGPQAEFDLYNFEALNFPPDHPARDMQDTLVLEGERLLRTHTSPVQVRTMLAYEPPIRVIAPGAVYRRDDDITHSPMFFQVEGLHVDRGVHMGHLKGVLQHFAHEYFGAGTAIRLRPSFFPFTEPSVEVDVACPFCDQAGCRVCSKTGWLEILGAGMVDPNVLSASGVDPEVWSGWAFGIGVERVAMLRHNVPDIRALYESDIRFLEQFTSM